MAVLRHAAIEMHSTKNGIIYFTKIWQPFYVFPKFEDNRCVHIVALAYKKQWLPLGYHPAHIGPFTLNNTSILYGASPLAKSPVVRSALSTLGKAYPFEERSQSSAEVFHSIALATV